MSRRANCTACTFMKNGVKTRRNIPHTCGKSDADILVLMETISKTNKLINEITGNTGDSKA